MSACTPPFMVVVALTCRKFSAVLGTTSERSCIKMRPFASPAISTSKKTFAPRQTPNTGEETGAKTHTHTQTQTHTTTGAHRPARARRCADGEKKWQWSGQLGGVSTFLVISRDCSQPRRSEFFVLQAGPYALQTKVGGVGDGNERLPTGKTIKHRRNGTTPAYDATDLAELKG